jgi:hypothetical protein
MTKSGPVLPFNRFTLLLLLFCLASCGPRNIPTDYHDPEMDFAAVRTVAILPFNNLTQDKLAAERVRDTFTNGLLASGAVYVLPPGEVARGIARAGLLNPTSPSNEEIAKLASIIKVDAVFTGVVREYGDVRSGSATAHIISVSVQMIETQSRKVVWTASSTKGGITIWDRLFGSGGRPMNDITRAAVNELLDKLFQ